MRNRRSSSQRRRPHIALLAITTLVVLVIASCTTGEEAICSGKVIKGKGAPPPAEGPTVSGESWASLSDLSGKVAVVNFWAAWCGPCRAETPMLATAARELTPTGIAFLGVDIRDDRAAAAAFESEFSVPYQSIFDRDAAIAASWGVLAPPATYVIAPDGRIAARIPGPVDRADLDCMVEAARVGSK